MGPYIVDGHFMYGNTFCMPRPPYYNTICHHIAPALRGFPPRMIANRQGDGVGYAEPEGYDSEGDCTNVVRSSQMPNITSITAKKITTLRIKLWGTSTDEDQTFDLAVGNRYGIVYLVAGGYEVADGYLEYIDSSISDDCTKYIGNYDEDVIQAYIGLDCSTTGKSDKRKIYLASIRQITELDADDDYAGMDSDDDTLSTDQRLDKIICMLEGGLTFIAEDLGTVNDDDLEDLDSIINKHPPVCCPIEHGCHAPDTDNDNYEEIEKPKPHHHDGFLDGFIMEEIETIKDDEPELIPIDAEFAHGHHKPGMNIKPGILVNTLVKELKNILDKLREFTASILLEENVDEDTDDGTETSLCSMELSDALTSVMEKVEEIDSDLVLDVNKYASINIDDKNLKEVMRLLALISRYCDVIGNGIYMEEIG